jgi:hypothetical protein
LNRLETWWIRAGMQCVTPSTDNGWVGLTPKPVRFAGGEATMKACGVVVAMLSE